MISCQKDKFNLPEDSIYFNNAYMSPLLQSAEEAGIKGLIKKRNPALLQTTDFFSPVQKAKETFAKLINSEAQQIAIIPSVSYGIANAAKNIPTKENGEIVLVEEQFPSNYYPWKSYSKSHAQKIRLISNKKSSSDWVANRNKNILDSINDDTTAVCLAHVHWADGSLYDLEAISQKAKKHHAALIIDGTQSVGALPFDIQKIDVDALVVASYKWLMGPYSQGLAYYHPKYNDGIPIEENWINKRESENFQNLVNYTDDYQVGAAKYSVGEQSNFALLPVMQSGLDQILNWGVDNIQEYTWALQNRLRSKLQNSPFRFCDTNDCAGHLTGIRISESQNLAKIKQHLLENKIFVSYRGDAMRVSLHLYNDMEQVDRFAEELLLG